MTTFGEQLDLYINRSEYSFRTFAKTVGLSHTIIAMICRGDRSPPADDKLADWATALNLSGAERNNFFEAGRSERAKAKKDSTEYVKGLEKRIAALEEENQQLREFIRLARLQSPAPPAQHRPKTDEVEQPDLSDALSSLLERDARRKKPRGI